MFVSARVTVSKCILGVNTHDSLLRVCCLVFVSDAVVVHNYDSTLAAREILTPSSICKKKPTESVPGIPVNIILVYRNMVQKRN